MATPKKLDDTDRLYRAIAKYLEKRGWVVITVGGSQIRQSWGAREFHYEFVVEIMGKKAPKK